MTTPGRRALQFQGLDQVMPDVDRLFDGHETVGKWSLAQICSHLSAAVIGSVDGYGMKAPWLVRKLVGPVIWRRTMSSGRIAEGFKIPEAALPKPGLDARAEAEALRAALRSYASHTGPMAVHPFFGALTRGQWDQLHRIHIAHHLSFARPAAAVAAGGPV